MASDRYQPGARLVYYPPKTAADDNRHWPAVVEPASSRASKSAGRRARVRVRIFMEGHGGGVVRSVSATRLVEQPDMFGE